jgi:hypothetical protein
MKYKSSIYKYKNLLNVLPKTRVFLFVVSVHCLSLLELHNERKPVRHTFTCNLVLKQPFLTNENAKEWCSKRNFIFDWSKVLNKIFYGFWGFSKDWSILSILSFSMIIWSRWRRKFFSTSSSRASICLRRASFWSPWARSSSSKRTLK